jgi:RNA polymerase-binding transcription factor DksA
MAKKPKKIAKPKAKPSKPTPRPKVKPQAKVHTKAKPAPKPKPKPKAKAKAPVKAAAKVPVKAAAKVVVKSKPTTPIKSKAPVPTPAPVKAPQKSAPAPTKKSTIMEKPSKKNALRDSILKRKATSKPIAFSLDEVRAIAKTTVEKAETETSIKIAAKPNPMKQALAMEKAAKPIHVKAASLADILGFNPKKAKSVEAALEVEVPEKYKRYYKLLLDLRTHLTAGIELHSEETLKRSSKDDAGDLSSYGQHMADAGTDTFDRDFALSLVSSEQEALGEIDAAIKRIKDGTYGICEITQEPIAKDRLLAVPFTRYSASAQKELERNRHRSRTQAGILGELGEDGAPSSSNSDDGGGDE